MYEMFFFNDTATTEIYTLSLHDALPISSQISAARSGGNSASRSRYASQLTQRSRRKASSCAPRATTSDRKSTRLNSSHANISYAVFCLKKKKQCIFIRLYNILVRTRRVH